MPPALALQGVDSVSLCVRERERDCVSVCVRLSVHVCAFKCVYVSVCTFKVRFDVSKTLVNWFHGESAFVREISNPAIRVCVCVCMCARVWVCVCLCVHIYAHIYVHTDRNVRTPSISLSLSLTHTHTHMCVQNYMPAAPALEGVRRDPLSQFGSSLKGFEPEDVTGEFI